LLAHAERCQLLRPNNLGSNLLQETLDLNKLRIAQKADKENTAPALLPTQLMPARTPIGPPLKRARTTLLSFGDYCDGVGLYSDESMQLAYWKQKHEESVCCDTVCKLGADIHLVLGHTSRSRCGLALHGQ
jgi:hypothetical protein